jgi:uncharacterized protein (DUF1800 family)
MWGTLALARRSVHHLAGLTALGLAAACAHGPAPKPSVEVFAPVKLPPVSWSGEKKALHVLNRLAYGPSPEDFADVKRRGAERWIWAQLHPRELPDERVDVKLGWFPALAMSTQELLTRYPALNQVAKKKGVALATPEDKARLRAGVDPMYTPKQLHVENVAQRLIRATDSRRQLQEVLLDFWFNHFNVSEEKGEVKWMVTSYERDAIRPHLFGRFRDLLGAVAHHPAMLFYLDNWRSIAPRRGGPKGKGGSGLNENYARELMELHTLGVEGGYTQDDVKEVARCFTGWSIEKPKQLGTYAYHPKAHDDGEKHVLGQVIPAGGGEHDGEEVLDLLADSPSTAHFIAQKLAQKFVSDTPPPSLVERVAGTFRETHGDLTQVYLTLFTSPEFWSEQAFASKTKTPLELAVSAVRALGGTTSGDSGMEDAINRMGEPLLRAQPPTGFPEVAAPWVNAGALLTRINFGLALANGRVRGSTILLPAPLLEQRPAPEVVELLSHAVLHAELSPGTRETLLKAVGDPADVRAVAGLLLGSPEFQKQ